MTVHSSCAFRVCLLCIACGCLASFVCVTALQAQGSWERVGPRPDPRVKWIAGVDSMTCFAFASDSGVAFPGASLYVTYDAGRTWQSLGDSVMSLDAKEPSLLTRMDARTLLGVSYFRVLQSRDTGRSWIERTTLETRYVSIIARGSRIFAADTMFASVTRSPEVYHVRFASPPIAWIALPPENPPMFVFISRGSGQVLWMSSPGKILRSEDLGDSWSVVLKKNEQLSFTALDGQTAWALEHITLVLWRTDDGGASWQAEATPMNPLNVDHALEFEPTSLIASPDGKRTPWIMARSATVYARQSDGAWDAVALPPGDTTGYYQLTFSRCRDGSVWCTSPIHPVFRASSEPVRLQTARAYDASSYKVKRACILLPHVGSDAWRTAIVERADTTGVFLEVGRALAPAPWYEDATPTSPGPWTYRVTFSPPAGHYARLPDVTVRLDRDSVLIIDASEYLLSPPNLTLMYQTGMNSRCFFDTATFSYRIEKGFRDRDTSDAEVRNMWDGQMSLRDRGLVYSGAGDWRLLGMSIRNLGGMTFHGNRFFRPPSRFDRPPDSLRFESGGQEGARQRNDFAIFQRHIGLVRNTSTWWESSLGSGTYVDIYLASTDARSPDPIPRALQLSSPFPNPASRSTTVQYTTVRSGMVRVSISDMLGRRVAIPFEGTLPAGTHSCTFVRGELPPGLYLLLLEQGASRVARKLILQ